MSETVPPSLAMLLLGSVTNLSVGALFIAGIVPAAVLAAVLIAASGFRSRRNGWARGAPFRLGRALRSMPGAIPALGVPVIVIGGIVGGIASPTEAGSLAVVYGLVGAVKGCRATKGRALYRAMRDSTLTAGMVLLMVAGANVLAQGVVVDGLGVAIAAALESTHGRGLFLLFSMTALIVIGFLLEGFPAILIAAPIFLPAATAIGVDPLQFGILLIMATGIGVMMPPAGIGFYIACTVGDAPVEPAMRASAVYNIFLLAGLIIVAAFPQLTLWLPHAIGLH
jgi:tripartite ATP-independent transporter DctM subunit